MDYTAMIEAFVPSSEQEVADQAAILRHIGQNPRRALTREDEVAHITSSGFILNERLDRVLMVHHNIRDAWAWTGGHADGDGDLLAVALREAIEETGLTAVRPLSPKIASLDILPVFGHFKRGRYVTAHLHLSVAYLLIADECAPLTIKPDENSGVEWVDVSYLTDERFDKNDVYLYNKLVRYARSPG